MNKNIRKKLKDAKGITLVALVVTIIVLLILAGVSLSAVFSQNGIFSRAKQATDKYEQAKAREKLELVLGEAQMQKHQEGLTDEQLTDKINEIGKEIEERETPDISQAIVDGYIFSVDRTVPKILDYIGPADRVVIIAKIVQNGWSNSTASATVSGTITKYGGGSVTNTTVTATNGVTIPSNFPTTGGNYIIPNIKTDTDITITTTDSEGRKETKTIHVVLVRDTTPPTIREQSAIASGMKITISAKAIDTESGLASFRYSVSPTTVKDNKAEGELEPNGTPIEIETTEIRDYTVTFTATDNANNPPTTATAGPVTTSDAISIADLKSKINSSNYPDYIGTKVDYNPTAGGTWRVFYYDVGGTFGDGAGTIYLKRDYDETMALTSYAEMTSATENGLKMMQQLNIDWARKDGVANLANEKAAAGLCDTDNWEEYKVDGVAKYAIGAPPIEMWTAAYNAYVIKYQQNDEYNVVNCGRQNEYGYGWGKDGGSLSNTIHVWIDSTIPQSVVISARK